MNPRYREPWGNACAWPREENDDDTRPRIDTADARKVRSDPNVNEYAAHDAGRARQRVIENRRASYYRGRRI